MCEVYIVVSKDGKYLRTKGYGRYGECWVEDLLDAKIYLKIKSAKAQATFWARKYPQYGIPSIHVFELVLKEILNQKDRVEKASKRIEKAAFASEINLNRWKLEQIQKDLERLEKEKNELKGRI
jgi:hypothetical protein